MKRSGRSGGFARGVMWCLFAAAVTACPEALAQPVPPKVEPNDPKPIDRPAAPASEEKPDETFKVKVSRFSIGYARPHEDLPPLEELQRIGVTLSRVDGVYTEPRAGAPTETIRLGDWVNEEGAEFSAGALAAISRALRDDLQKRGLTALFVIPHPEDIAEGEAQDLREGRLDLRYEIYTGVASAVRTVASGERLTRKDKTTGVSRIAEPVNNPKHARILNRSPVQAGDLLRGSEMENYAYRLSRHPGRSVDIAISSGSDEVGDVVLDYLVSEAKPWSVYFQLSNTGTDSTGEWRERFGFIHNQLTGNDDIFRFDYITAGFDDYNAYTASYEFPIAGNRLRAKVYGLWSEYTASDVGVQTQTFEGEGTRLGAELTYNVFQRRKLFVDLFAGARWENQQLRDVPATGTPEGDEDFFIPAVGARLSREGFTDPTFAQVWLEWNWADVANTDAAGLENFRREDIDDDWTVLKWDFEQSLYLEPLLNRKAWRGEEGARKGMRTLAHELAVTFRGQEAFGNRLTPTEETVLGGAFTVRGYPESSVAGDSMWVATLEYRFHVPRVWGPKPTGKGIFGNDFRWAPSQEFGMADWDLILRGFYDFGETRFSEAQSFEIGRSLSSVGVGAELQVKRNLTLRADWGYVLDGFTEGNLIVEDGDHRVHFIATLLF